MSYVSLLKNIPEILSQPTGIAAIASLGIHGAIALVVPLMPVDSAKSSGSDSTKAVGLMELSAADQNRLPQTVNPSQVALQQNQLPIKPQIPLVNFGTEQTIIPPLEAALPNQQVLPPIPSSPANYNLSYLPRRQPVQQFARNDLRTQVSNFRVRNTFSPSASPFVGDIDAKIKETQPLNINRLPQVQADNKLPSEPLINPSADAIDIGSTSAPQGITGTQNIQLRDNSVQISANSPAEVRPEQSLQDKGQLLSAAPVLLPSTAISTSQQREVPVLSQSDSQGKEQLLAKLDSYNTLRKTVRTEYPDVREQAVIRETISTNQRDMEGTVLGRLVVDPDGKVLDIKFQDRSVAPALQSKTREFFSANPPKGEKRISSYPFQLRFKNNNGEVNIPQNNSEVKLSPSPDTQKVSEPQVRKNPSNNQAVIIPNPSPAPVVSNDQPTVSATESGQKLIQKLRQIKEDRQNSN
ncbi:MAG: hypothetical protein EAZ77_04720 [Nostocales cyanobacterium]|nr:MAG: hypothetical protein EAZ77_04720 [Nostocales cyanobacterium]